MNLLQKREEKKMTQEKLAELTGLTRQAISAYETKKAVPSVNTAKKIAAALGFDWQRFYEE